MSTRVAKVITHPQLEAAHPGGAVVRLFDEELAALVERGFTPQLALRGITAVVHYTTGAVLQEQAQRQAGDDRSPPRDEIPTLTAAMAAGGADPDAAFAQGHQVIIDGIAGNLAGRSQQTPQSEDEEAAMSERNTPSPGVPYAGAEQAQRCVDAYVDAWNEPVADKRRQLLAQAMTDKSTYVDPTKELDSREGLVEYIGEVLNTYPGGRVVRTSEVDMHHLLGRFNWRLIQADGTQGPESIDFVEFAGDGRIHRVAGFFGPLLPRDALRTAGSGP